MSQPTEAAQLEALLRARGERAWREGNQPDLVAVGWAACLLDMPELGEKMLNAWTKRNSEKGKGKRK